MRRTLIAVQSRSKQVKFDRWDKRQTGFEFCSIKAFYQPASIDLHSVGSNLSSSYLINTASESIYRKCDLSLLLVLFSALLHPF